MGGAAAAADATDVQREREQDELKAVYDALRARGALRAFGSIEGTGLLPAPSLREVTPEDQLRLTGLPTSAFAPPRGNSRFDVIAGASSALLLTGASWQLGLDPNV